MGGRLYDWLGGGIAADLPAAAGMAALLGGTGSTAVYFETDTKIFQIYDESGPSWFAIDAAALAAIALSTMPDVDIAGLVDGDVLKWDNGASLWKPLTLLYNTLEKLQDAVGPMFANGTGITAAYNDGTGMIDLNVTITQYTDELAQDAIAALIAAGTHVGITITYDDALNKISFTNTITQYSNAMADARIAAANINDLADVGGAASNGDVLTRVAGAWAPAAPAAADGNLIGYQVITATGAGTYTPTVGTRSIMMRMCGGGAGGGGVPSVTAGNMAFARGGSGGATCVKRLTSGFSGAAYSVGAGGNGGAAGANAGANGGDTTFNDGVTIYTAGGGIGGNAGALSAPPGMGAATMAGGTATNGDLNIPGGRGSYVGISMAVAPVEGTSGGGGGSSQYGTGADLSTNFTTNSSTAGTNGVGHGSGGSGAVCNGTGAAAAGGNGTGGLIEIWEFS